MNRVLGLDVGKKRIGVALSDPLGIIAQPYDVVLRTSDEIAISQIKKICEENSVKTIIVGLPKNMNGSIGIQAEDCQNFSKAFQLDYQVFFEDERLTSRQAENILKDLNKKYTKDKKLVDIKSACIILQQYLDRR